MIHHIKIIEKRLIDKDMNWKLLAKALGISTNTLNSKLKKDSSDFKLYEAASIADELSLTDEEFFLVFFNKKLSSNERLRA